MKSINICPVCNSTNQKDLYSDTLGNSLPSFDYNFSPNVMRTYKIVKCLSCSHAFCIIPQKNIWENYQSVIDPEYINRQKAHILTSEEVIKTLIKFKPCGKLLDVGCATGDFLSVAQKYYTVEGIEPSKWSSDISKEQGFKIHTCLINELPSDIKFDIITLWGGIEHFESLQPEIKKMYDLLNPNGIVCIWTGDIDSLTSRLLGRKWWYIQGQHIQFFSKKSLNKLFLDNNFKILDISTYPFTTNLGSFSKSFYRYQKLKPLTKLILENKLLEDKTITIKIPGEMLAIYQK